MFLNLPIHHPNVYDLWYISQKLVVTVKLLKIVNKSPHSETGEYGVRFPDNLGQLEVKSWTIS